MTTPTPPQPTWWPLIASVTHCLCANLAQTVGGPPGRCCALPGGSVILDDCCQGTGWVRLDRIGETTITGSLLAQPPLGWGDKPCGDRQVQIVLGIGAMRCAASSDERGTPPSCEVLENETLVMLSDIDALYRTASCCMADLGSLGVYSAEPALLTPQGPAGGCVGSELTVGYTVDLCPCVD